MEQKESRVGMLDLMIQPAFTVKDGVIHQTNAAAGKYFLESGMPVADLLCTGKAEYGDLQDGCLYLSLFVAGMRVEASVRKMDGFDIFTLEQDADHAELQAMALAAQELRGPLSNVMSVADRLFPVADQDDDPMVKAQVSQINRGLFQMLRIIGNMSDAYRYSQQAETSMTVTNIPEFIGEIFQSSGQMLQHGGVDLCFENVHEAVFGLIDQEMLERAIHNIISNAVKFSAKGKPIHARLSRRNNMLYLTVQDSGNGIDPELRGTTHSRFRRQPGLEDSRFGIGLGMVMIRSAAAAHGGTVLLTHPDDGGTKLTMSIAINQNTDTLVRSKTFHIDYAGERNHALTELSDVLPSELYETQNIN